MQWPLKYRVRLFGVLGTVAVLLTLAAPRVYSQAQALLYGSYNSAAKAVTVDSAGRLNISLGAGVVTAPNGGTGLATLTAHNVLIGNGTGVITLVPGGTDCFLHWATSGVDPTCAAATGALPAGATNTVQYNAGSNTFGGVALNATATNKYLQQVSSGVAAFVQPALADLSDASTVATVSGAGGAVFTITGATAITLPTSGTMVTSTVAALSSLTTIGAFPITTASVTSGGLPYF